VIEIGLRDPDHAGVAGRRDLRRGVSLPGGDFMLLGTIRRILRKSDEPSRRAMPRCKKIVIFRSGFDIPALHA
jgi:hypothetical protein